MSMLGESAPARASGDPLKILVVDDEPAMVGALGALLGQAGHRIIAAYDGEEALRRFREDAPDLILLDLSMPGMDGRETFREVRRTGVTSPVVFCSAYGAESAKEELGAEGAINKPFNPESLIASIQAAARNKSQ